MSEQELEQELLNKYFLDIECLFFSCETKGESLRFLHKLSTFIDESKG